MKRDRELIKAVLKNDTAPRGSCNYDGITFDPTIVGALALLEKVHKLKTRFYGAHSSIDITAIVQPNVISFSIGLDSNASNRLQSL